jgi:hypothetical protein
MKATIAFLIALILSVGVSCTKKKTEDPKPAEPQEKKEPQPTFARMRATQGSPKEDGSVSAIFNSTQSGKDIYTIKATKVDGTVLSSITAKVWWESGEPKSDVLTFMYRTEWSSWTYTWSYMTVDGKSRWCRY